MEFIYEGVDFTYIIEPNAQQKKEALAYALLVLDGLPTNEESIKIKIEEIEKKDLLNNEEKLFEDYDKECCLELMKDYLWRYV